MRSESRNAATRESAPRPVRSLSRYGLGVPAQRTVADEQRSAFGRRAGVPSWGAVLIAVTATIVGVAFEAGSGHQELGTAFATMYVLGCFAAVLFVRQSSIFTAVVQPPLLLFVAVPLAYFLLHSSSFGGIKDIAINCGYPLIERFPLMLFTTAAVLLMGMTRWFLAMSPTTGSADGEHTATRLPAKPSMFAGLTAALASAFSRSTAKAREAVERQAKPRHGIDRASDTRRPRPERRPADPATARSRRPRPPLEDLEGTPPRRRQPTRRPTREPAPPMDPPRRRPRAVRDPERTPPPPRRETRERRDERDLYPPRPTRTSRPDPYETDRGYPSRGPYPPYEPRRRAGPNGSPSTHHPVSRVRYRDPGPTDAEDLDSYRNRSGR